MRTQVVSCRRSLFLLSPIFVLVCWLSVSAMHRLCLFLGILSLPFTQYKLTCVRQVAKNFTDVFKELVPHGRASLIMQTSDVCFVFFALFCFRFFLIVFALVVVTLVVCFSIVFCVCLFDCLFCSRKRHKALMSLLLCEHKSSSCRRSLFLLSPFSFLLSPFSFLLSPFSFLRLNKKTYYAIGRVTGSRRRHSSSSGSSNKAVCASVCRYWHSCVVHGRGRDTLYGAGMSIVCLFVCLSGHFR